MHSRAFLCIIGLAELWQQRQRFLKIEILTEWFSNAIELLIEAAIERLFKNESGRDAAAFGWLDTFFYLVEMKII